jgi:hypothetical protein
LGLSRSGSTISALTPHTMVVLPRRTSAEPLAVPMEPICAFWFKIRVGFRSNFVLTDVDADLAECIGLAAVRTDVLC